MIQLFVGIIAEGSTDYRFLEPIIRKSLTEILFDCHGQIDIETILIDCDKGANFSEYALNASKKGFTDYGISILIIHTDSDSSTNIDTYKHKIDPVLELIKHKSELTHCKNIAALIPIQETESWMLADKELLIKQIGTIKTEVELKINGNPENINNPKEKIEEAIKLGRINMSKKMRKSLKISELYSYLGEAIQIDKLRNYSSYIDFEDNVKKVLRDMNILNI